MAKVKIYAGIFLFSFSSLAYEITLIRIFSISLWYHFAFMIISIAMLGIGASGTVLSLYPKIAGAAPVASQTGGDSSFPYERIGIYGLLLGAGISLSYMLSNQIPFDPVRLAWERVQIFYICLYYMILSIPFLFFGFCMASAFSMISEKSGLLYGSDLLGAGAGSIVILFLLSITAPEKAIIIIASLALLGAFIIGRRWIKITALCLITLNFFLLTMPDIITPRMSPYKSLQVALKFPGAEHIRTYNSPYSRIDTFKSPAARFAPGLSLKYLDPLPEQIGLSIDGGEINALTHAGDNQALKFLTYLPSALSYEIGKKDDVLILEPKGGLEVLLARYYNSKNIYKVDSNPLVIKVIRDDFTEFSQGIYSQDTWSGIGRSWLKKRDKKFDAIDIPLMGASPGGFFGIAEDYRFTVEAFKEYLGHLKDNGILSIHLFILHPPRTELRLLNTMVLAMDEIGIADADKNIAAIRSWGTVSILAKKSPFSFDEIESIKKFCRERRFDLIYLPGITEQETNIYVRLPSNEYPAAFKNILDPETRKSFQRNYIFDISPVRDENPFFPYYLRLKNIKTIYRTMGEKWQYFIEEGYLLPMVFIQALLLSIIFIFLPAVAKRRRDAQRKSNYTSLIYFALLGLGFMFVEITMIQKMILPLENPSYAVSVVLTSILISSGTGSLLSHRFSLLRNRAMLFVISFLIIAYSLIIPAISDAISPHALSVKIVMSFIALIPLGFLMGIPFPLGIKSLGAGNPSLIPWAWAVNGCFSVLSPILTIMLAIVIGFKAVLWMGGIAYLLAFFTFPSPPRQS
ncbi:MAG: hypothetical protein AABY52_05630 [Deltaproteobacteria bacterium]